MFTVSPRVGARIGAGTLAAALVLAWIGISAAPAAAAPQTFHVTNTLDDGSNGSLRWAITQANGNTNPGDTDLIDFQLASPSTITLTSALPDISEPVEIEGPGRSDLTVTSTFGTVFRVGSPSSISGMSITTAVAASDGIELFATELDASDLFVDATDCSIAATGSLVLTNAELTGSVDGLCWEPSSAASIATITDVNAHGNNDDGIQLTTTGSEKGHVTISGGTFDDNGDNGVEVTLPLELHIDGASATDNNDIGILIEVDGDGTASIDNTFTGANGTGLRLRTNGDAVVTGSGNEAANGALTTGVLIWATGLSRVTFTGTYAHDNGTGALVWLEGGANVVLDGPTRLTGNTGRGLIRSNFSSSALGGTLRVDGATISGNQGGVWLHEVGGTVRIENSTISGNTTAGDGGGIRMNYPEFPMRSGRLTLQNTTVSGNSAANGGAIFTDDALNSVITILNSTFTGNTAGTAPGILTDVAEVHLRNTILADATQSFEIVDAQDTTIDGAYSIVRFPGTEAAPGLAGTGMQFGVDPKLGPLADNGGATLTHLLLAGSPAIETGDPAFVPPPALDQRLQPRVVGRLDIGAVEVQPTLPATGGSVSFGWPLLAILLLTLGAAAVVTRRRLLVK